MRHLDEEKRARIIQDALRLFAEQGFDTVSINDIAAATGLAKGTLYLYFPSKEALIDAVFYHCHLQNISACAEELEHYDRAADKLCRRMENAIRFALSHPLEAAIERLYLSSPSHGAMGPSYIKQPLHVEAIDVILRAGIECGELKALPSALLGEIFFGVASAFYHYFNVDPSREGDQALWEKARQTVCDCLAR